VQPAIATRLRCGPESAEALSAAAGGEDGVDEIGRDVGGKLGVRLAGLLAEADRLAVAREVIDAVGAKRQMALEDGARLGCELAVQVGGQEVDQLATGEQGILQSTGSDAGPRPPVTRARSGASDSLASRPGSQDGVDQLRGELLQDRGVMQAGP